MVHGLLKRTESISTNLLCDLGFGLGRLVKGLWFIVYGLWSLVSGLWSMVYGL